MGESALTIMQGILPKKVFFNKGAGVCTSALEMGR